jgi:hypothetical protein
MLEREGALVQPQPRLHALSLGGVDGRDIVALQELLLEHRPLVPRLAEVRLQVMQPLRQAVVPEDVGEAVVVHGFLPLHTAGGLGQRLDPHTPPSAPGAAHEEGCRVVPPVLAGFDRRTIALNHLATPLVRLSVAELKHFPNIAQPHRSTTGVAVNFVVGSQPHTDASLVRRWVPGFVGEPTPTVAWPHALGHQQRLGVVPPGLPVWSPHVETPAGHTPVLHDHAGLTGLQGTVGCIRVCLVSW